MTRRCLIVDQSTMVRRVAARIIREFDFEVMEAKSGQDALDQCAGLRPDVVMLDWKLPDMSGQAFMESLRDHMDKNELEMPTILFCTAERSVEQIVSALKAGADEYIMKPFDSDIIGSKFALAGLLKGSGIGEGAACAAL